MLNSLQVKKKSIYFVLTKTNNKMKTSKKQQVKVLGQTVTVGTKLHAKLIAQVKHFNDLTKYETN